MSSIDKSLATGSPHSSSLRFHPKTIVLFVLAVVLAFLMIFPLLWMISTAFKGPDAVNGTTLIPSAPTWANFVYVFTQVPFLGYMLNSFVVAVTVTLVALLFHSMAAYSLAWLRFPGRDVAFLLIFSTFLVSLPIILVPLFILVKLLGWLDSFAGLIVPAIFNAFGIFLLRQFYLGIPKELGEAAIIDGCGHWRVYWHLILPLSKPILATLAVFFFLANWNSFLWPLTATNDPSLRMVQIGIASFQSEYAAAWNYIMAASTVAALPTLILFFIFQRQLVQSIKSTGFK